MLPNVTDNSCGTKGAVGACEGAQLRAMLSGSLSRPGSSGARTYALGGGTRFAEGTTTVRCVAVPGLPHVMLIGSRQNLFFRTRIITCYCALPQVRFVATDGAGKRSDGCDVRVRVRCDPVRVAANARLSPTFEELVVALPRPMARPAPNPFRVLVCAARALKRNRPVGETLSRL